MSPILISIFGFILAIGLLVTIHESGHFWVARFFGIRVLRFSIGFGRRIFHWYDKSGTEYVIACIPLGGYVALLGEKEKGQAISGSDRYEAYCYKPVWVRMAVLVAGPCFNLLFAVLAYWLMFMIGIASMAPILGNAPQGSIAALAGLHAKHEIVSIENKPTPSWEKVSIALMDAIGKDHSVEIQVREGKNKPLEKHILDLTNLEKQDGSGDILKDIGFVPLDPYPAIVGKILPETPAEKAGLQSGDRIVSIDGHPVHSRADLNEYVQSRIGENLQLQIIRQDKTLNQKNISVQDKTLSQGNTLEDQDKTLSQSNPLVQDKNLEQGSTLSITIQPISRVLENGKTVGFMGIEYLRGQKTPEEYVHLERYGVGMAFWEALKRTGQYTVLTFDVLKKMLVGTLSVKQISGPIAIAQYAGFTVSIGIEYFLSFLAVISIGLGVINLLPIPLLDGGQLMYCVWELITGRVVSDQTQKVGIIIGGGILMAITLLAFYNDIVRLIVH